MKLHFHPVSTASRPVVLFLEESKIPYEPHVVDLMTGAHLKDEYKAINPSAMVPAIEDDGFVLTESSAILKYLAEKHNSPAYPKDLKKRARINEVMDWFNTQLYREWAYHLAYPQLFPHHKRPNDAAQEGTLEWGKAQCAKWLEVLDKKILGSKKFLTGDEISIADYFGAEILSVDALIGNDWKKWPNVDRWMGTMRALPSWKKVNEAVDGFGQSLRSKQFVTV